MTTIVEQLSAYAIALRYEDLPSEVVQQAKRLIVDSVRFSSRCGVASKHEALGTCSALRATQRCSSWQ